MAQITREDVAHVARLARLQLTEAELDTFTGQLAKVLDHARDAVLAGAPATEDGQFRVPPVLGEAP